ncbi:MAG: F420-dependent NADP oxidoreductase [Mesorhizobium sp.]|uniref:pyrroline-5-carboxylate reductase n=1 Tax=unclassified Mesorhizobium TaxID=325217 RepID=UPI000FCC5DB9|nr:pyrroline-5-carboxylate reductase [Mesorhizobium sp. M2A.F.Ca.ET.039.01.1.1]RWB58767.1 MAG: F420-dependent NADP oxidoreductase [Mesorhizobium sp.]RWX58966.1 F420-dependent NADP oxidoreductase [Mesorhizobium sp. M2A.F.Ca.ET.039.01.1.1]TIU73116.1 MAG: F420-dependent NADP oxidoreductase [Mesorhizobium sp.]
MKLGFIGTGALTAAIITGLKSLTDNSVSVLLSPRNEDIAAGLASRYPDVRIASDNQAVLDNCDTIMLAVRPQISHKVLPELRFRPNHHVVSLIATLSREQIAGLTIPAESVTKALPMPMLAHRLGATIVYPPHPGVASLFGRLGKVIEVENSSEFDALSVATATYGSYFKYLETIHRWLKEHGVRDGKARDYIASLFKALANAPEMAPEKDFMHLSEDYATRGGINEQVLRELTAKSVFDAVTESLDRVYRRIICDAHSSSNQDHPRTGME